MDSRSVKEILARVQQGDKSVFSKLEPEERKLLDHILTELADNGTSMALEALWEQDYRRRPVSIDEFLDNEYYLGRIGSGIFPKWREELRSIFDPRNNVSEWIIRGCIGAGKTTVAVISLLYKIHILICMKNPQKFYGLIDESPIVFGLFNVFKYLAKSTAFSYLVEWTKLSPFFLEYQDKGDADYLKKGYIHYPNKITIALGSQAIHALGQNIFGGLLDEADMGKNKSLTSDEMSQVADSYGQVRSRIDSRFLQRGGTIPGILILVSQVRGKDAFLEKHSLKVQNDPNTRVTAFSLWEIKDWLFDMNKTFNVAIGDQKVKSFIVPEDEDPPENLEVVKVPEELRPRFEYSLDDAIRDLAGRPTYGSDLFLPRRDKLTECYENSTPRSHPFTSDTVTLSIESGDDTTLVDYFIKDRCMFKYDQSNGNWRPLWYAGVDRAVHVDLSKSRDCTGISMGCIGDIKEVTRFDADERPYTSRAYSVFIDFAIRVEAAKGSEIDFGKIRQFIFYLHSIGFNIRWVSYDGFQCFSGDTKVSLLDGTERSLEDLYESGEEHYFYSVDKNNKVTVGGPARVRKTGVNAPLVKVTLDNGESVRCTPDHLWMLRDGTYCPAMLLTPGTSLRALYRDYSRKGYESYQETDGTWRSTYKMVADWMYGDQRFGMHIHHADFNKCNNDPTNLVPMDPIDHFRLHSDVGRDNLIARNKTRSQRESARKFLTEWHRDNKELHRSRSRQRFRKMHSELPGFTESRIADLVQSNKDRRSPYTFDDFVMLAHLSEYVNEFKRSLPCSLSTFYRTIRKLGLSNNDFYSATCLKDGRSSPRYLRGDNHKVVSVEPAGYADVYDVENVPVHHNYALSAGVFVHNSVDSLQQMKKAGYDVKLISVDRKPDRYNYLKNTIYEGRFDMYPYHHFTSEITRLQDFSLDSRHKPPIDHPPGGSKDVSDGVCGVTARLLEEKGLLVGSSRSENLLKHKVELYSKSNPDPNYVSHKWIGTSSKSSPSDHLDSLFED